MKPHGLFMMFKIQDLSPKIWVTKFLIFFIVFSCKVCAVEIPPLIGDWVYAYDRCSNRKDGFADETVAALAGAEFYYNFCGDPMIVSTGHWGLSNNMVFGTCGSSKPHPHPTWDFTLGVESYNGRHLSVSLCRTENNPEGVTDGLYISRTRTVECPHGSQQSGRRCFSDYAPRKQLDDVCAGNPISFLTGNKFELVTDYDGGVKNNIKLVRIYNSVVGRWGFNFEKHLVLSKYGVIFAHRPNGE